MSEAAFEELVRAIVRRADAVQARAAVDVISDAMLSGLADDVLAERAQ